MDIGTKKLKIAVGMSGGVDSSVAAALLQKQGHQVVGVTLKLWGGQSDSGCCSVGDVEDARFVAKKLGIDHHVWGFVDEFNSHVVDPYIKSHARNETPNPCIECNRHLKFDLMAQRALRLGFDAIATGHYARIMFDDKGRPILARSVDDKKDQSYVLSGISKDILAFCRFPLGDYNKSQVRMLAQEMNLLTADKPDSQDVCFILATGGRREFLSDKIRLNDATIVEDATDEVLGEIEGMELLTIGQRREIGISRYGQRQYVLSLNPIKKEVRIGPAERLLTNEIFFKEAHFLSESIEDNQLVYVQVSAHGKPIRSRYFNSGKIVFEKPQRKVAPGQIVAFYDDNNFSVVGSATVVDEPNLK